VIEPDGVYSQGALYCSLLYSGPDGKFVGKHGKLKPDGAERSIWGEGDGSTTSVFTTEVGNTDVLINYGFKEGIYDNWLLRD